MQKRWLIACLLAALTVLVFARVLSCDFVNYDDPDYVTANSHVQAGLKMDSVKWAFFNLHGVHTYWHPVTWISHMLDAQFFGLNPKGHHFMSLLFHTANVVLLFLILDRMTGAMWPSAAVAGLFAVHPLQVDSVAWITERKNLLCLLFWLLTILCYHRYVLRRSVGSYVLTLAVFTLGLMCKPVMVALPFALLLLDYWPLQRIGVMGSGLITQSLRSPSPRPSPHGRGGIVASRSANWKSLEVEGTAPGDSLSPRAADEVSGNMKPLVAGVRGNETNDWKRLLRHLAVLVVEKIPFLALAFTSSLATVLAHRQLEIPRDAAKLTFDLRVENAFVSYARYLRKFFWPSDLAVLYPHPYRWPTLTIVGSAALILGITAWVIWRARREPYLFVGWFWFIGVLVSAIGLIQVGVQSMADRFAYIPLIGLNIMIVWKVRAIFLTRCFRQAALLFGCVLAALASITWHQIGYWKNSIALWEHALAVDWRSPIAHMDLAAALVDKGRDQEAIEHYQQAVRFDPFWPDAYALMGATYAGQKQPKEAVVAYRRALELKPNWTDLMNNLAWILATSPDASVRNGPEAVRLAQWACQITTNDLPMMTGTLAAAYAEAGDYTLAVKTGEQARDLAIQSGNKKVAARNEELIAIYKSGMPYHEP